MSVPSPRPFNDMLPIFGGPVIWFFHLTVIYGSEAFICMTSDEPESFMIAIGVVTTVLALAALGGYVIYMNPHSARTAIQGEEGGVFLCRSARLLAFLATIGVIWTAFSIALIPACKIPFS